MSMEGIAHKQNKTVSGNHNFINSLQATKILQTKRIVLKVIESLIETNVSEEYFLQHSKYLSQSDYQDIVEERNTENLCGYPLCSKVIEVIKQQYHISTKSNKVYDIKERKCFCSNQCYKASCYVKSQMPTTPIWMCNEKLDEIKLLPLNNNRGKVGEEIEFSYKLTNDDIEKTIPKEITNNILINVLHKEVEQCASDLKNLKVKENYPLNPSNQQFDSVEEEGEIFNISNDHFSLDFTEGSNSEESDEEKYFSNYDDQILFNKFMPIPLEIKKKTLLISPLKPESKSNPEMLIKPSLDFAKKVLKEWVTEDTLKYLFGEQKIYTLKADLLFKKMVNSQDMSSTKLASIKNEYVDLCLKLDKLEDNENLVKLEVDEVVSLNNEIISKEDSNIKKNVEILSKPIENLSKKRKIKVKKLTKDSNIKSSEKLINEVKQIEDKKLPEPILPLVDSLSQNILRRQILYHRLQIALTNILPHLSFYLKNVCEKLKRLIDTFSLTPFNIILKPNESKLIALILLKMLNETILANLDNKNQFLELCKETLSSNDITEEEIDNLISDVTTLYI